MTNRIVSEVRYDLASDIALLDGDSQIALLDLGLVWAARNLVEVSKDIDLSPFEVTEGWSCLLAPTEPVFPLLRKVCK